MLSIPNAVVGDRRGENRGSALHAVDAFAVSLVDTVDVSDLKVGALSGIVELSLDAVAMKGRRGYRSGVRPNHWLPGRDYACIGQLEFLDREWLGPGEACKARGRFIIAEQDLGDFVPGFAWDVGEARRIVGRCKLLSLEGTYEPLPSVEEFR